ncbi:MAG: hypothetical protein JW751_25450 [Polyangiaceae bacterium]|nr:hypothetical protein [Polyangiaceae bacterium]
MLVAQKTDPTTIVHDPWQEIAEQIAARVLGYDHVAVARLRHPANHVQMPLDSPLDARLREARAEAADIRAAAKRVDTSSDPRAQAARDVLADALVRAESRVDSLSGFRDAFAAGADSYREALIAERDANLRLHACEPEDAAAASIAVATAQAATRKALRTGLALIDAWRASAAPVCPALTEAMARAAAIQQQIDSLRSRSPPSPKTPGVIIGPRSSWRAPSTRGGSTVAARRPYVGLLAIGYTCRDVADGRVPADVLATLPPGMVEAARAFVRGNGPAPKRLDLDAQGRREAARAVARRIGDGDALAACPWVPRRRHSSPAT